MKKVRVTKRKLNQMISITLKEGFSDTFSNLDTPTTFDNTAVIFTITVPDSLRDKDLYNIDKITLTTQNNTSLNQLGAGEVLLAILIFTDNIVHQRIIKNYYLQGKSFQSLGGDVQRIIAAFEIFAAQVIGGATVSGDISLAGNIVPLDKQHFNIANRDIFDSYNFDFYAQGYELKAGVARLGSSATPTAVEVLQTLNDPLPVYSLAENINKINNSFVPKVPQDNLSKNIVKFILGEFGTIYMNLGIPNKPKNDIVRKLAGGGYTKSNLVELFNLVYNTIGNTGISIENYYDSYCAPRRRAIKNILDNVAHLYETMPTGINMKMPIDKLSVEIGGSTAVPGLLNAINQLTALFPVESEAILIADEIKSYSLESLINKYIAEQISAFLNPFIHGEANSFKTTLDAIQSQTKASTQQQGPVNSSDLATQYLSDVSSNIRQKILGAIPKDYYLCSFERRNHKFKILSPAVMTSKMVTYTVTNNFAIKPKATTSSFYGDKKTPVTVHELKTTIISEGLISQSQLYESIILDLMKVSAKKQRAANQPKKIKLTKGRLQDLLKRQLK